MTQSQQPSASDSVLHNSSRFRSHEHSFTCHKPPLLSSRDQVDEDQGDKKLFELSPTSPIAFYRAYSRRTTNGPARSPPFSHKQKQSLPTRESFFQVATRTISDISAIGELTSSERSLLLTETLLMRSFPSGRALWVAGTPWSSRKENASGFYNCTSTVLDSPDCFGLVMNLAMMGCGTGVMLEEHHLKSLPAVRRGIIVTHVSDLGTKKKGAEGTILSRICAKDRDGNIRMRLRVGDSRAGWVEAYQCIINLAYASSVFRQDNKRTVPCGTDGKETGDSEDVALTVDLTEIRPPGSPLAGFGGTANPVLLGTMLQKVCSILTGAKGRRLSSIEACLLIDEAAAAVVAGNIRRSAGMRQFSFHDEEARNAKLNLYTQDRDTKEWKVDPKRESLRLANHTIVFHRPPTLDEVTEAVRSQHHTGEGAIQYVPEAIIRANADLFHREQDDDGIDEKKKQAFLSAYEKGPDAARDWMKDTGHVTDERELRHRLLRYGLNPCGEIIGCDFHCNLTEVHLNQHDPLDRDSQGRSFYAAGLQAAALLKQQFSEERYQYSRDIDPIVGVSFTGLFDFFVHALGKEWLDWMLAGRQPNQSFEDREAEFLRFWRSEARRGVLEFCANSGMPRSPNRITCVQPAGTKSLLTGASPGWHPPKAVRFVRRITIPAHDPVALASVDYGYNVIPASSARDEHGRLLNDINDPRSTEWLVEIPTEVSWANLVDDEVDLSRMSAAAQFGLYMSVQTHYADHNTSATIEFCENEIKPLARLIHGSINRGYISAALLAKFHSKETYPRMPFEPVSREEYNKLVSGVLLRRKSDDFAMLLEKHDQNDPIDRTEMGEGTCTSAACLAKADEMEQKGLSAAPKNESNHALKTRVKMKALRIMARENDMREQRERRMKQKQERGRKKRSRKAARRELLDMARELPMHD